MPKLKVLSVFGTRPEAIKMAPVMNELSKQSKDIENIVCVTAQHRQMLDQVLELFKINSDFDLNIMKNNQNLWSLTSDILLKTKEVFDKVKPDIVLVHGDTTTALAASLSAFYASIPVGHVEAGLRTYDKNNPFPEEINRILTDSVSEFYFCPTQKSIDNLLKSNIKSNKIHLTGNTVIDALFYTIKNTTDKYDFGIDNKFKTVLLTSHRRENFGKPLENICDAIIEITRQNKDVQIICPVHLNPNVRQVVYDKLQNIERVKLIEPLEYEPFCKLMEKSDIILTDSGGIQEEAPSIGKPVLLLREETERPEAIEKGVVKLVGANKEKIVTSVNELLNNKELYNKMSKAQNPYGDGLASRRIVEILLKNKDMLIKENEYANK